MLGKKDWQRMVKAGEGLTVEFKVQAPKLDRLARTFSAFANSSGGFVFFGVDDDCKPVGLTHIEGTEDIVKQVSEFHCEPVVHWKKHIWQPLPHVTILIIQILEADLKPVYAVNANNSRDAWPYFRSGKENLPLDKKSIKAMRHSAGQPVNEEDIKNLDRHGIHMLNMLADTPRLTLNKLAKSANISTHRAKKIIVQLEQNGWIHGFFNEKRREYSLVVPWKKR